MSSRRREKAVVTGGAGFIGCNLASRLAGQGLDVVVVDTLIRPGVNHNLDWLLEHHGARIRHEPVDVRDAAAIRDVLRDVDVVFHLAAQTAVTTSFVEPRHDFEVNLLGTLNVLEACRHRRTPVIFASTNKVYGDLADIPLSLVEGRWQPADASLGARGIDESWPLDFRTPYGCSKGGADQYVLDYARSFRVPACVLRMSCIYGPRQRGTEDQGWVAHFMYQAFKGRPLTIYGDGRQVRDVLNVRDAVDAYMTAWRKIADVQGRAFNLGGGPENAISLRDLIGYIEALAGFGIATSYEPWRAGDQRYFVADTSAARSALGLSAPIGWRRGVAELAKWIRSEEPAAFPAIAIEAA